VYRRYSIYTKVDHTQPQGVDTNAFEEAEGEFVYAQDALDREAVLQAQIRTLETQIKDSQKGYKQVGASWDGMVLYVRVQ
jgi:DNA anti-recombination protein RmuC